MLSTLYALYAVMKDDNSSSVVFLSQTFILWTKRARRSESFRLLGGWVKIHQIPWKFHENVMFETASQFFFKLCITLNCFFLAESVHDLGKRSKVQNFRLWTAHVTFYQIFTLIAYKILAKKCRGVMSHDPEDWCEIWRKTDLLFKKWQESGGFWPEH